MKKRMLWLALLALVAHAGSAVAKPAALYLPLDSAQHCLDLSTPALIGTAQMRLPAGTYKVTAPNHVSANCHPQPCTGEVCTALVVCETPAPVTVALRGQGEKTGTQIKVFQALNPSSLPGLPTWKVTLPAETVVDAYFTDGSCAASASSATLRFAPQ